MDFGQLSLTNCDHNTRNNPPTTASLAECKSKSETSLCLWRQQHNIAAMLMHTTEHPCVYCPYIRSTSGFFFKFPSAHMLGALFAKFCSYNAVVYYRKPNIITGKIVNYAANKNATALYFNTRSIKNLGSYILESCYELSQNWRWGWTMAICQSFRKWIAINECCLLGLFQLAGDRGLWTEQLHNAIKGMMM